MSGGTTRCEGVTPPAPNFDAIFSVEDEAAIFDVMKGNNNNKGEVAIDSEAIFIVTTTTCTAVIGHLPSVVATTANMTTTTTTRTILKHETTRFLHVFAY